MFQPFPSEIFFQNFTPSKPIEVPLTLRNNDKVFYIVSVCNLYFDPLAVMFIVKFMN